jgi:hypothetical protein
MATMLKSLFERLQKRRPQPNPIRLAQEAVEPISVTPTATVSSIVIDQSTSSSDTAELTIATTAADILRVEEVTDPEFYIGDLFRRRFGGDPPNYPRHFVAFYRPTRDAYQAVGYVHYSPFEDTFLCGGLVIDDRLYRKMPSEHRRCVKEAGGIAELMLRDTFARLADAPAIWGYVGNKQAEAVDLRAGFVHTHHKYVMVVWNRALPEDEKAQRLDRVIAIGPF